MSEKISEGISTFQMEDNKFILEKRIQNIERFILSLIYFLIFFYLLVKPDPYIRSFGYVSFFPLLIFSTISYIYVSVYFCKISYNVGSDTSTIINKLMVQHKVKLKVTFLVIACIAVLLGLYVIMNASGVELKDIISSLLISIIVISISNVNKIRPKLSEWIDK